jgi:predicted transcriptional regulator
MKLPVQKNQNGSAKCLILLGSRGQKTGKTGFGVELGGSVTIKLDAADRVRISALAAARKRTPHYLMKEAILEYVKKEEARQNFITAAQSSFEHYKQTGLHITLDEFSSWVDQVQHNPTEPVPACHT